MFVIEASQSITIECPHCNHALEGKAQFGLDIIRCKCGKFVKLETFARAQRVVPARTVDTYAETVDKTERV